MYLYGRKSASFGFQKETFAQREEFERLFGFTGARADAGRVVTIPTCRPLRTES